MTFSSYLDLTRDFGTFDQTIKSVCTQSMTCVNFNLIDGLTCILSTKIIFCGNSNVHIMYIIKKHVHVQ